MKKPKYKDLISAIPEDTLNQMKHRVDSVIHCTLVGTALEPEKEEIFELFLRDVFAVPQEELPILKKYIHEQPY